MIHKYQNGNYTVEIDDVTGTKIRTTEEDKFISAYPESIDCSITYKCNGGCDFCYMGCTENGKHANLNSDYINNVFLPSLQPYTELALNGNDLSHPQLCTFLQKLKEHNVIANITVNQKHFIECHDLLYKLYNNKLIHGIGVSLTEPNLKLITLMQKIPSTVLHVIAGVLSPKDIIALSYHDLKLLILGYKRKGRGNNYYVENAESVNSNIDYLKEILPSLINQGAFNLISFDNLALDQLSVRLIMSEEQWEEFYMGNDGDFTYYCDLVNMTYAKDSLTKQNYDICNKSVIEMFKSLKELS